MTLQGLGVHVEWGVFDTFPIGETMTDFKQGTLPVISFDNVQAWVLFTPRGVTITIELADRVAVWTDSVPDTVDDEVHDHATFVQDLMADNVAVVLGHLDSLQRDYALAYFE